jgi:cell division protein FtsB
MVLSARRRRRITQIVGPVFAAAVVAYFTYYTVYGERGLIALSQLRAEAARAEATLAATRNEREAFELKVTSLRSDSLDLDRLDERARILLNDSRADELIIRLPDSGAAQR